MEINKESSHFLTNIEMLKNHIYKHLPTICTICESNSKIDDDLEHEFPEYDIIRKTELNHTLDRVVVLVKKESLVYERMESLENNNIASKRFSSYVVKTFCFSFKSSEHRFSLINQDELPAK